MGCDAMADTYLYFHGHRLTRVTGTDVPIHHIATEATCQVPGGEPSKQITSHFTAGISEPESAPPNKRVYLRLLRRGSEKCENYPERFNAMREP